MPPDQHLPLATVVLGDMLAAALDDLRYKVDPATIRLLATRTVELLELAGYHLARAPI